MMKCWKVTTRNLSSASCPFSHLNVQYSVGEFSEQPANGYPLTAFGDLESAQFFVRCFEGTKKMIIFEAVGEGKEIHENNYKENGYWPEGTVFFRSIKLVKEVERTDWEWIAGD